MKQLLITKVLRKFAFDEIERHCIRNWNAWIAQSVRPE